MNTIAVIEAGGKQYCVSADSVIEVEIFDGCKEGESVDFDKVLFLDDGTKAQFGAPYIAGKKVVGTINKVDRRKKISVMRFRSKSNYRRHYGHRQPFCQIKINSIG